MSSLLLFDPDEPEYRKRAPFLGQCASDETPLIAPSLALVPDAAPIDAPRIFGEEVFLGCPSCDAPGELVFDVTYEPAEPNYGADRDGKRGIYLAGYFDATPVDLTCTKCGVTADDTLALGQAAVAAYTASAPDVPGDV